MIHSRILSLTLGALLLSAGCGGETPTPAAGDVSAAGGSAGDEAAAPGGKSGKSGGDASTRSGATTGEATSTSSVSTTSRDVKLNQPVCKDTKTRDIAAGKSISVPMSDCASVKSSPIALGDVVLMPFFEKDANTGCKKGETGPYAQSLLGYDSSTGELHQVLTGSATEGTLSYDAANGRIYWPVMAAGALWIIDADKLDVTAKVDSIEAQTDSHGTFLDGLFYFGTVNAPGGACNGSNPNKDCGALYAADSKGNIKHRLDVDDGFRTWVVGGPTTDGESLYIGGSPECDGDACWPDDKGYKYRYGCSVIKTDKSLKILKSFDPGITGCLEGGNTEDAIAGEIVLGKKGDLWAQYSRPNDKGGDSYVYQLDEDLNLQCSFGVDYAEDLAARSTGFYQAPTVDKDGNAYVVFNLPQSGQRSFGSALYKVEPCTQGCGEKATCKTTELYYAAETGAFASPTLVDDKYALFATQGKLLKVDLSTGKVAKTWELGDKEEVHATPVVANGEIYVISVAGTITVIKDAGVTGYGSAIWPRFRADNQGSARPSWASSGSVASDAGRSSGGSDGSDGAARSADPGGGAGNEGGDARGGKAGGKAGGGGKTGGKRGK